MSKAICRFANIVHNILTNPIYAGAYAFGCTTSRERRRDRRHHLSPGFASAVWSNTNTRIPRV
jgi:hypothetical protein